ncbi:hypothetical protein U4E84_02460 [Halorubrum sp. AD140]|uniref:hypothetical protein n=1 Tax=Halorubrum sp. AD140 TaxID=3050073 RepID=UPI002ACCEB97|nr:hypothetical protein [Halorubrum sp. AD140]MDZ5810218.1 hypothetical protein [Halorubrum sp. AD140]
MSTSLADRWERAAPDPDPVRDLGYEIAEWDERWVSYRSGERLVLVPTDEDEFERDAYIVADARAVCDPIKRA